MMSDEDPTPEELLEQQRAREEAERARAADAPTQDAEHAADRRADKAAYLREKLTEQTEHPDEP